VQFSRTFQVTYAPRSSKVRLVAMRSLAVSLQVPYQPTAPTTQPAPTTCHSIVM